MTLMPLSAYLIVGLIGLAMGSFLNVVIVRLPKMLMQQWRQCSLEVLEQAAEQPTEAFNLIKPRSHCPKCQHPLRLRDNIPLLSFLWRRGRCAFCQQPISKQYPLVELLSLVVTVLVFYQFGLSWQTLAAWAFSWSLIALTVIDMQTQLLPDVITLPLLWLGLIISVPGLFVTPEQAIIAASLGYGLLWLVGFVFKRIRGKIGMGHGDFKLLAAIGAWVGVIPLVNVLALASILGIGLNVALLLTKKINYNQAVAFGPALAIAGWFTLLYGPVLTNWLIQH